MSFVNEGGFNPVLQDFMQFAGVAPAHGALLLADASGEKIAALGCVWHPTVKTGSINIRKVWVRFGTVTFNGASVGQISLQSVSLTAGPPYQPDGTPDETVAITPAANSTVQTGALSADRVVDLTAVNIGDANSRWLAVVFEETTFTAADSVIIRSFVSAATSQPNNLLGGAGLINTAGVWSIPSSQHSPVIWLECDDGSMAFIRGCFPFTIFTSLTTANNAAFRAAGVKFSVPTTRKLEAASLMMTIPNICDGSWILYDSDGTTALVTVALDNDAVSAAGSVRNGEIMFPPVTLLANTFYRFVFVPSTTTAATLFYGSVNAAAHMDGLVLGQNAHLTTRNSGGVWTDTVTDRPHFGLAFSAFDDAAGGGGMPVGHQCM